MRQLRSTPTEKGYIDVVAETFAECGLPFDYQETHIRFIMKGSHALYHFFFEWAEPEEVLHVGCGFVLLIPEPRLPEILGLLNLVNQNVPLGHFETLEEAGMIFYRAALPLPVGSDLSPQQCQMLLAKASKLVERYLPAFHFVAKEGQSAQESFKFAEKEIVGRA